MFLKQPSVLACVTGQYDCDRIIEAAQLIAGEEECELKVVSVLYPNSDYTMICDTIEYLNAVAKSAGADMTIIFDKDAASAVAAFAKENDSVRIVSGMHDGGKESFLVKFNQTAPDVSISMVDKDGTVYSMDICKSRSRS